MDTVVVKAIAMYKAFDTLQACEKGSDEYINARMAYADAKAEYDSAYENKMKGYTKKIN